MPKERRSKAEQAAALNEAGLRQYHGWHLEDAIKSFQRAIALDPEQPDYHLNLARALARSGDFDRALHALADFMALEPEGELAERFQAFYGSAMDDVERLLTEKMREAGMGLEEVGAAIQMWLEYRIAIGRRPLRVRKPASWAAALDYTVRKINVHNVTQAAIARYYGVSEQSVGDHHKDLVKTLDLMPCDYRYFVGPENPLDKLVEAAEMLEELERKFQES